MFIIVEGLDGAGKTTFASRLLARAEAEGMRTALLHRGPPTRPPLYEYEVLDVGSPETAALVVAEDALVVADRWHWDELVYGSVIRRASRLTWAGKWHVDAFLAARTAGLIYLDPGIRVCAERIQVRGDDLVRQEHLKQLHTGYRRVYGDRDRSPLATWRSTSNDDAHVTVAFNSLRLQHRPPVAARTYVGTRSPRVLLVGDTLRSPSTGQLETEHVGAFVPYPGTSGEYLITALRDSRTLPRHVGMLNVNDEQPDATRGTWEELGRPPVVALGRLASRGLEWLGIPHGVVPHPQYVRRFFRRATGYAALIARTASTQEDAGRWPN